MPEELGSNPNKAYMHRMLWLPKIRINPFAVKSTLRALYRTAKIGQFEEVEIFQETDTHILVPRHYQVSLDGIPVVDMRARKFRRVEISTRAIPREGTQTFALDAMLDRYPEDGILNLACGKGKSPLVLMLAAQLNVPIFVVVNTEIIMKGWMAEISGDSHIEAKTNVPRDQIGIIQAEHRVWKDRAITLCMLHTLARHADEWPEEMRAYPGLVVFDECHRLSAKEFSRAATVFDGPRLGLTATIDRPDRLEFVFLQHLGELIYQDLRQELNPKYVFVQPSTVIMPMDFPDVRDKTGKFNTARATSWLARHQRRNEVIIRELREAMKADRCILVLSHSVEHTQTLRDMLGQGSVVHGGIPANDRRELLFSSRVVFATFQLVKEGLNKPELDTLFCVTPFSGERQHDRSSISLPQAVGRICRKYHGKKSPLVVFFDDHKIKRFAGMMRSLRKELSNQGQTYTFVTREVDP